MMKKVLFVVLASALVTAAPALKAKDDGDDAPAAGGFGGFPYGNPWAQPAPYSGLPAPVWSPNSQFNPYNPVYNPYHPAAYPMTNPMHPSWGHPAFNPAHPLNNPWHPANAFAGFPSYAQAPEQGMPSFLEAKGKLNSKAKSDPEADTQANPWSAAQSNWNNYFSGPTSEFQWPGAEEARPGVHPTLGGTLNPWSPLGAPTHPYPFPMHQGLKNGPDHPRPFTLMGQYYPGTTGLPFAPQFAPSYNPWGFASQPTYFPAAQNGDMSEEH
jgi:hypothetical protein